MASTGEVWRLGRRPALDGIRGLAILLVVQQHLSAGLVPWLSYSGPVGVTVFFVLSGYLISRILLAKFDQTGRVDLPAFYRRRAARLLPALLVVLAATPVLYLSLTAYSPRSLTFDTLLAGTYLMNFAVAGGHHVVVLGHTWSLAVEEQFYLLWPLVLLVAMRRRMNVTAAVAVLLGLAVAWRVYATFGFGMERVYFAPDTNSFSLLTGCLLASLERDGHLPTWGRWAGRAAALGLVVLPVMPKVPHGVQWSGLAACAMAAVLIVAVRPSDAGWLTHPVMRWLGDVSYGWYLWHGVLVWLAFDLPGRFLMAGLSLAVAWLSWRYIEQPMLRRFSTRPAPVSSAVLSLPAVS